MNLTCSKRVTNRGVLSCSMRIPTTLRPLGARLRRCVGSCGPREWTMDSRPTPRNVPGSSVRRNRMRDQAAAARSAGAYDGFLLDLDGTLYRGTEVIAAAPRAVARLRDRGAAVRFVTNNAARTAEDTVAGLLRMGFSAVADDVYTS